MRYLLWFSFYLLLLASGALLSSCGVGRIFRPTPAQQLSKLIAQHPELQRRDTVTVHDTITVPAVRVETRFVYQVNPVRERADSVKLDSLLQKLQTSLDTAKRRATVRQVHYFVRTERPAFPDTLCFDTLGLKGKVWRAGRQYRISLLRKALRQPHETKAVVARLQPCSCAPTLWYDPRTWPWLWLGAGFLLGITATLRFTRR